MAHCAYNGIKSPRKKAKRGSRTDRTAGSAVQTKHCIRCGQDSGTANESQFVEWYIAHRALTCRGHMHNTAGEGRGTPRTSQPLGSATNQEKPQ